MDKEISAAFFDLDGTLLNGDSQEMEFIFRLRHSLVPLRSMFSIIKTLFTGILSYTGIISLHRHNLIYMKTYKGMSEEEAFNLGEELFHSVISKKFNNEMLKVLRRHRDEGALIIIVSAAPEHILRPVIKYLNPDMTICTGLETEKGTIITGNAEGELCMGKEKVRRIRKFAEETGIDLSESYAYSDHHADIPFLEAVGRPVVVNPTFSLRKTAESRGWPLFHFR